MSWIVDNAATLIIGAILLIVVVFAIRYVVRKTKKGQCIGCEGCSGHSNGDENNSDACNCSSFKQDQKNR